MIFISLAIVLILCYLMDNRDEKKAAEAEKTGKKADNKKNGLISNKVSYPNPSGKNLGEKNNNPLNMRVSKDKFIGEIQPSGDPNGFKQFESYKYGFRAAFRDINTKIKNGNDTISKIITKWAPPKDGNNTALYIEHVEKWSGINRNIKIETIEQKLRMVQAMTRQEIGYTPTLAELKEAYKII